MYISANIKIPYAGSYADNWTLEGSGGGYTFAAAKVKKQGNALYADLRATKKVENKIEKTDLEIAWKLKIGGNELNVGTSKNRLYVTGGDFRSGPQVLYETVLDLSCGGANGVSLGNTVGIVDGAWSSLSVGNSPKNPKTVYNEVLKYWGAKTNQTHLNGSIPDAFSLVGLLKNADSRCGGWRDLFASMLYIQGLSFNRENVVLNSATPLAVEQVPAGYIGEKTFQVATGNAQGNSSAWRYFGDHALLSVPGVNAIFDPSYGKRYDAATVRDAKLDWTNQNIDGVRWVFSKNLGNGIADVKIGNEFTPHVDSNDLSLETQVAW